MPLGFAPIEWLRKYDWIGKLKQAGNAARKAFENAMAKAQAAARYAIGAIKTKLLQLVDLFKAIATKIVDTMAELGGKLKAKIDGMLSGAKKRAGNYDATPGTGPNKHAQGEKPPPKGSKPPKKKLQPGSPEHKAARWEEYQARGGKKDYAAWSKQYDTNMRNYKVGAEREATYRESMGATEGTVKTPLTNRQIDVLKADEMYAGQVKSGPVSLTKENILAIQKDAELVKQGWQVEHILEQGASKPYLKALDKAGISYHIGVK